MTMRVYSTVCSTTEQQTYHRVTYTGHPFFEDHIDSVIYALGEYQFNFENVKVFN